MPCGYGRPTGDAAKSFHEACRDMSQVRKDWSGGSLLGSNFNALWCGALNRVHEGLPVKYFAMLHDDVGLEEFWLDTLIGELERAQLDVLCVALPIKDNRGLSSLALDNSDTWLPHCRLTMHDVLALPETFTSADLPFPLLLNTGCWVCRFDIAWARLVHFEVNDRIVFNRAANKYMAQTEPEDWFFSRLCRELGLRLGATRKLQAIHTGDCRFPNYIAWGQPFDTESRERSPIADAHPWDVPGWLMPEEGAALTRLARGKRVLEIGSYCGLSTICLARSAASVVACDYFDGRGTPVARYTRPDFDAAIARHGVADRITVAHPDEPLLGAFDLAFIDGDHSRASIEADVAKAWSVLAPNGLLVFHDYGSRKDREVQPTVDAFCKSWGVEILEIQHSLAVVKPPALIPTEV
jgi:hypothetical protein